MKSAKLKILFLALVLLGGGVLTVHAAQEEGDEPWMDRFFREFANIQTRLDKIEERQQEILDKEDKLLAELDRLRVWVHRR
ncbi:MAG: hypothetical protein BWY42_00419 [Candidatus Omnitrophica bacterium ADurb.Bin277]|nr:MAG: hypothetical protein BWY42_00419 [Candidatus Omnitrophica bacterium ADurb.Bin277]